LIEPPSFGGNATDVQTRGAENQSFSPEVHFFAEAVEELRVKPAAALSRAAPNYEADNSARVRHLNRKRGHATNKGPFTFTCN